MAADSGRVNTFLARHEISGRTAQMLIAGVVALVVLVAAIIALPRTATKTASRQAGAGSNYGPTNAEPGAGLGNVPGAGTAGTKIGSSRPGTAVGAVSGTGSGGSTIAANNPSHVSSHFVPARGPGITSQYIYFAAAYSSQSAAGDRAIGAAGAAPSYDLRDVYNAAINYANTHGGFAGRRLKPLYYDFNLTDDIPTQEQAACAYWTQDHKIFAMTGGDDVLDTCAERAHAVPIGPGATAKIYKKYPHLISPDTSRFDRLGQLTVVGLHKIGYFGGKLGLVTWDDPNYREAMQTGYLDTLSSKYNIKPLQVAYISVPQNIGALSDTTAQVSSAVAKFKSLGIDHVMIQDGNAGVFSGDGLTFEWMQQSKSQNYHPRYGGNNNNSPGFVANPPDQEDHMLAIDDSDSDKVNDAGWHTNQFREKCFKIQADAGLPVNSSHQNDEGIASIVCDEIFMLQRLINATPAVSNDNVLAALEHLGKGFGSALVYGTNFFPGRHDGSDMVRPEEFLASCNCLHYKGPPVYAD